jgi:hypothetical protein
VKNVSAINEAKDVITREYVDNRTAEMYTSVTDDFDDYTLFDAALSNGTVVDGGLVRPLLTSYTDDFSTQNNIDFTSASTNSTHFDVVNGVIRLKSTTTVGSVSGNSQFKTKDYSFVDSVFAARLTANFTTPAGVAGFTTFDTPELAGVRNPNESLSTSYTNPPMTANDVTINGDTERWVLHYNNDTNYKIRIVTPTTTIIVSNANPFIPTQSDTLVRTSVITEDSSYVYVAYPTAGATQTIVRINKSTLATDGPSIAVNVSSNIMQMFDMKCRDNRLHLLWTDSTARGVQYNFVNTNSWGSLAGTTSLLISAVTTSDIMYSCQLVLGDVNRIGWCAFTRRNSSNSVHFGIIDTTSNNSPYQFKNAPAPGQFTTHTNVAGAMTITSGCNGFGCMVYDTSNSRFYIMALGSASGLRMIAISDGQSITTTVSSTTSSATVFDSISRRNISAIIENTSNVHLFLTNETQTVLEYTKLSFATTPTVLNTNGTELNLSAQSAVVLNVTRIGTGSPFQFRCNYLNFNSVSSSSYRDNIQPILRASINDDSYKNLTSDSGVEFGFSSSSSLNVIFRFIYPVNQSGQTALITFPTTRSVELNSYTLEQISPAPTPTSSTSTFVSKSLVTDRIVRSATLDITQNTGTTPGNSIQWEVASLANNWVPISTGAHSNAFGSSSNWTATFNDGYYGSQLRVRAMLTRGAGANLLTQVPRIEKYIASVRNVVTVSDIFPLQINLMKLGLQVNTLSTANRLGYKNMMIDVFQTSNGVLPEYTTSFSYNSQNGIFTNTSGSSAYLTSQIENADIAPIRNIIVVGDTTDIANGITYEVRRGEGTWVQVTPETVYTFTNGIPDSEVRIRALVPSGVSITGWAYLYA